MEYIPIPMNVNNLFSASISPAHINVGLGMPLGTKSGRNKSLRRK